MNDRQGSFVEGLTPQDFQASIHNRALSIQSVRRVVGPNRVLILLDASGSMTSNGAKWVPTINMAKRLAETIPESSPVALVLFSTETYLIVNFDESRATLTDRINALPRVDWRKLKQQRTALLDALKYSVSLLGTTLHGDAIVIISDGDDNASMENEVQLQETLLTSETRVFGLIPGPSWPPSRVASAHGRLIKEVVQITGGEVFDIDPFRKDLPITLLDHMSEYYSIVVRLGQPLWRASDWRLTVQQRAEKLKLTTLAYLPAIDGYIDE